MSVGSFNRKFTYSFQVEYYPGELLLNIDFLWYNTIIVEAFISHEGERHYRMSGMPDTIKDRGSMEKNETRRKMLLELEQYIDSHYVFELETEEDAILRESSRYNASEPEENLLEESFLERAAVSLPQFSVRKQRRLDELLWKKNETFSEMLLRLIDERGLKDSQVYRKAGVDRRLFSKIRSDADYTPAKKTALSLALALELSLDETKDLLMRAGYALSNSSKSDIIISFFIENEIYDLFEINEALAEYQEPTLN